MTRTTARAIPAAAAFVAALLALGLPAAALAHAGADSAAHHGAVAGFLHPLTGIDHFAAMLAVGFWSAVAFPSWRRAVLVPLAFAGLVLGGAIVAAAGIGVPAVEPMVAASLLAIGLLVAVRARLPLAAAAALASGFAVFHGAAHGAELAALGTGSGGAAVLAGIAAATLMLHAVGLVLGSLLRHPAWARLAGGLVVACGAAALLPLVA